MTVGSCVDFNFMDKYCSLNMLLCFAEERMSYRIEFLFFSELNERVKVKLCFIQLSSVHFIIQCVA